MSIGSKQSLTFFESIFLGMFCYKNVIISEEQQVPKNMAAGRKPDGHFDTIENFTEAEFTVIYNKKRLFIKGAQKSGLKI